MSTVTVNHPSETASAALRRSTPGRLRDFGGIPDGVLDAGAAHVDSAPLLA
ncbi:hypothetical protein ACIA8K_30350 [Catenuloplanes sp. NPDC051500]|uniref:hypothetical protein n=1 Tax=Catenuloplanes sp. NPDC051500 TaxID=3363959 RepID=UPI0037A48B79